MSDKIEKRAILVGGVPADYGSRRLWDLWVEIHYDNDLNPTKPYCLSITGVLGPKANGDAWGGCGQITDELLRVEEPAQGFDPVMIHRLWEIWERWHLNGMNAGTPAQEDLLREKRRFFPGYPTSYYDWAKATLEAHGLQPDNGYSYGSAWLHEDVPDDVLDWLRALPEPTKDYPWDH